MKIYTLKEMVDNYKEDRRKFIKESNDYKIEDFINLLVLKNESYEDFLSAPYIRSKEKYYEKCFEYGCIYAEEAGKIKENNRLTLDQRRKAFINFKEVVEKLGEKLS
jgi:hypothetical protein